MRQFALLLVLAACVACDPGYFKRLPVLSPVPIAKLEAALSRFEDQDLGNALFRATPPKNFSQHFRDEGYEIVRWYDSDAEPASSRGSFYYVALLIQSSTNELTIEVGAFPSLGEPPAVTEARKALLVSLCEQGFYANGGCDP